MAASIEEEANEAFADEPILIHEKGIVMQVAMSYLALLLVVLEIAFKKLRVPGASRKPADTGGKRIGYWLMGALVLLAVGLYAFVLDPADDDTMKWFWLSAFIAVRGSQALWEWRYTKRAKDYLATLLSTAFGLIYIYFFLFEGHYVMLLNR
ncbi:DUF4181 domain-containing protein [Paenibacillus sp. MWE-103]|uniref:DUF4181 domain-containing protein n=1 Tax=Paenibacillus artemisiicola TaxID=1172618 RepID=A0ABS3W878_9BACL|nr:DUF4181 domain-containing protein [Paenibacillus artemisiicola]MBO7744514.1 DUF4181 domain-containing protein [Paenibacillus artemisiicola]